MSLPSPLVAYRADLERAVRRRRAGRRRRARAAAALAVALLGTSGLAAAGGVLPLPFDDAPRAVTYTLFTTSPDGTTGRATCRASGAGARCSADRRALPLNRLTADLQRRGVAYASVTLTRVCRRPGGCRTAATGTAAVVPGPGQMVSESAAGLRPPPPGARITAFTVVYPPVRGGVRVGVIGGPFAGRTYACDGPDRRAALCRIRRAATTRRGMLDVDAVLRATRARAWITETGRRCPLTGGRPCRGIAPEQARGLAFAPSALAPGEGAVYERQVVTSGFTPVPGR